MLLAVSYMCFSGFVKISALIALLMLMRVCVCVCVFQEIQEEK